MVIEFKYCGLDVKLNLVEADSVDINPLPIMGALINMFNAISYYRDFDLVITSKGDEDGS